MLKSCMGARKLPCVFSLEKSTHSKGAIFSGIFRGFLKMKGCLYFIRTQSDF
nr:MAG TPA: hypothetical protein [Caudoviricetes sp.]